MPSTEWRRRWSMANNQQIDLLWHRPADQDRSLINGVAFPAPHPASRPESAQAGLASGNLKQKQFVDHRSADTESDSPLWVVWTGFYFSRWCGHLQRSRDDGDLDGSCVLYQWIINDVCLCMGNTGCWYLNIFVIKIKNNDIWMKYEIWKIFLIWITIISKSNLILQ